MEDIKRTAVVTGAGRGIGRAIAVKFASKGYNVVINYAGNDEAANETLKLCKETGCDGEYVLAKGDISDEEVVEKLVSDALDKFKRVDVLVNNAGITRDGLVMKMSTEDFDKVISTNLRGAFLMSRAVTRPMMKQRYGRIISISSVVGVHGNAGQVNYSASKAGLIGMSKSLAKELAARNITANVIAPGMIETDMTEVMSDKAKDAVRASIPAGHAGGADDIANAVAFLAAEESGYITGQVLGVDGGMGM
ncbi:MAG: 3-oxoacyl-[acyl-carrier-protein] reductase [Lachnospiraceae bacterium]|nr:3-oxoacyl-[acyl-carrier-protein] reductase [Lachnospiraceae bacterium]